MSDKPRKTKKAVGLKYESGSAPKVIATGEQEIAEEIIAIAKEHGVLVHEDEQLSQILATLELGDEIPKELYIVIAELIAFSYILKGEFPDNWNNMHNRIKEKV
ncbi:EscU/YscU/HrcU family type III secretion system export apparatus switch protein [Flocculibacter collagenilyticus]|uniref:EscU/YscU/HrcU family type III secretion system export apparatus switch protein n=1 Tax=Flocculibacter collagenilyticus TaxID=2744479 RepID=UPI0018F4A89D|nr:EscU/YscU/HrcU family type III secretion system export apparatus switch protein [Flocculibacter collagenilyticus]